MGYYTRYEINFVSDEKMAERLVEVSGYQWDGHVLSDAKWYDWQKDLKQVSDEFPYDQLELEGRGEESGDHWRAYAKAGMVKRVEPTVEFEEPSWWPDSA